MAAPGQRIAGRYELLGSLGSGGMAEVYRAHDEVLQRDIAIKLLRTDIGRDDNLRERFLREARLAGRLTHQHIVRVYDAGVDDDTPWIAMELVDGPSLRDRMDLHGDYALAEVITVARQVLEALAAAHALDVVHRDVKPANILMAEDGAKLGDFGIAKSLTGGAADLTQLNEFVGTPKYTAPEVAMGETATPRSDVYAVGVLMWEMLAGHPPFDHPNPLTLAMMHRTDPLPSLAQARPGLPAHVVAAIERALQKEPVDRHPGAPAFAAALAGAPVPPAPPAPPAAPVPAVVAPSPPQTERTVVMDAPSRSAPRHAPPPARRDTGRVVLVLALVALAAAAVIAFQLADGADDPAVTPTPTAPATDIAPTTPQEAPSEPLAPVPAPPTSEPPPPPPSAPPPPPPPAPPPEPTQPPATTPPTQPPATAPPDGDGDGGLIPLPLPEPQPTGAP